MSRNGRRKRIYCSLCLPAQKKGNAMAAHLYSPFDESSCQLSCGLKTRSLYAMSVVGIRYPAKVNGRSAVDLIWVADSLIRYVGLEQKQKLEP